MNNTSLLKAFSNPLYKKEIVVLSNQLAKSSFELNELIDLTFDKDVKIGFRAAWVLENIYSNFNDRFIPSTGYFLDHFSTQQNLTAMRHFAKILSFITHKKANPQVKSILINFETTKIVDTVYNWLIDEKVLVATKSFCLNILADLCPRHKWIKDELSQTMDFLVDKESIGFYAKVKKIRKQLALIE